MRRRFSDQLPAGDFNQSMMELGATVCVPREPRCPRARSESGASRSDPANQKSGHNGAPGVPARQNADPIRQIKKEIWCVLSQRDGQHPPRPAPEESLAHGWHVGVTALVEEPRLVPAAAHWRTFRHSITVTDYTVHVLSIRRCPMPDALPKANGSRLTHSRKCPSPA